MNYMQQKEILFGTWLRKQRRALDLSRQAFADQVGCAAVTLRRIEIGTLKPSRELANILLERLGIPASERLQWISFARGTSGFPLSSNPPSNKSITNLPAPLSSFIGREKEQADVAGLIARHRLITLAGSGGVGKTRLAIKVSEQALANYADGVWLVELAPIFDPLLVARTTAMAIGLHDDPQRPIMERLCDYLHEKEMLFILDNCEHLLDACAQLVNTLLKSCPGLKILATSREPLGITGEAIYRVPSLGLPDAQQVLNTFRNFEAVKLFEERAQLVQTDFSLTMENAPSVAQICSRLDGIPLAIELAAAKVNLLSTKEIAGQLETSFNLLTNGSRTALPRQQTIHASIEWSWNLLSNEERILMRQLSVFAGGWTLESAQAVCDGEVVGLINSLVKKSLIVLNQLSGSTRRYRFHEMIRQYARQSLLESDEEKDIRTRHLQYFLQLSEEAEPGLRGPTQTQWLSHLNDERDNIRAALGWAIQTDIEAGLYITGRLYRFWERSEMQEASHWLAEFIENPESKMYSHARAKALHAQGWILIWMEQLGQARLPAEECFDLFEKCGDRAGKIDGLILLGYTLHFNQDQGMEMLQQAHILARSLGDTWRQARALHNLGGISIGDRRLSYYEQAIMLFRQCGDWDSLLSLLSIFGYFALLNGNVELAQQSLDEAVQLSNQSNDKDAKSVLLQSLGAMAFRQEDYRKAYGYYQEALDNWDELGTRMNALWCRTFLGYIALHEGNLPETRLIFEETIQQFQRDQNIDGVLFTLEGMAGLHIATGRPELAARLIGWADATRERIGDTRPKLEQADIDKDISAIVVKIGNTAFEEAHDLSEDMTLDEAVALALEKS